MVIWSFLRYWTEQWILLRPAQGITWFAPEKEGLVNMLQRWTIAYPRSLKAHLTYNCDLEAELKVPPPPLPHIIGLRTREYAGPFHSRTNESPLSETAGMIGFL